MLGMALVWMVLFIGDLVSEGGEEEESSPDTNNTSLFRQKHLKFLVLTAKQKKAQRSWNAALTFAARSQQPQQPLPSEVTPAQALRERLHAAAAQADAQ